MGQLIPYRDDDPLRTISQMLDEMRSFVRMGPTGSWLAQPSTTQLPLNVTEDEKQILVEAAIPGVSEDDIEINVTGDVLSISAETRGEREESERGWHVRELHYGKVARSVRLPKRLSVSLDSSLGV